jgi:hypothetical protein
MVNKIFSSYNNGKNKDAANNQLIVEVGLHHLACLVKNGSKQTVRDFELFKIDNEISNFEIAFGQVLLNSILLDKTYADTSVIIHNEKSLIVPSANFSKESSHDYLNVVFGETNNEAFFVDSFASEQGIVNIYRISSEWLNVINKHLEVVSIMHTYTKTIAQLFQLSLANNDCMKVAFYDDHLIVALISNKKLQIIQNFNYQSREDVLYYLLSIVERFNAKADNILLAASGMVDVKGTLFNDLKKYFKRIIVEETDNIVANIDYGENQKYYYTPFLNLAK